MRPLAVVLLRLIEDGGAEGRQSFSQESCELVGRRGVCPCSEALRESSFSSRSSATVRPFFLAMEKSVSPFFTA